jgi:UDP-N-acetylglucosamine--N-acetylmuramyl-(pentapeptide) pyrophosphoryl-undecaprenol N-acetylglucosamine transferase
LKQFKVILSGGGTGGHIFPAVAIANEIKLLVPSAEILFVGALGKMEMEKVPAAGFSIVGIPIAGFQRRFTFSNLKLPFLIIASLLKTRKIIKEFKPHVVIGTGGYVSGPLLRAACSAGIPTLIQEQNSFAGVTNKILSRTVSRICVAYEGMEKFFPAEKILLTGNPVRQDISLSAEKKEEGRLFFKLNNRQKTILIIGGSLGARSINHSIGEGLEKFSRENIQILWQTGKEYYSIASNLISSFSGKNIHAYEFISRMDLAYAVADVVVSRAGASSVSELCNLGLPCILVPSPNVAEDHQTKNALALVNKNAAVLVKDSEANNKLVNEAILLVCNEKKQQELKTNITSLAFPNSANIIAREVLKLAGCPI